MFLFFILIFVQPLHFKIPWKQKYPSLEISEYIK